MSTGQAIGAIGGGIIGFISSGFNLAGAAKGAYWGYMAGTAIDPPPGPHTEGPRLNDRVIQTSEDGAPLPTVFGTVRLAGNVIWSTGLEEIATTTEQGGGSGGGGATTTNYSYKTDAAIALCAGEITGVRRIWADAKLIYDVSETADLNTLLASNQQFDSIRVYTGSETQNADPLIQAIEGAANTPAFRGMAYVVFEDLQLADFGNRLPNFSFEVVKSGDLSGLTSIYNVNPLSTTFINSIKSDGFDTEFYIAYFSSVTIPYAYHFVNKYKITNGEITLLKQTQVLTPNQGLWLTNWNFSSLYLCRTYNDTNSDYIVLAAPQGQSYAVLMKTTDNAVSFQNIGSYSLGNKYNYIKDDYLIHDVIGGTQGFKFHKISLMPAISAGENNYILDVAASSSDYLFITVSEPRNAFMSDDYIYLWTVSGLNTNIYRLDKTATLALSGTVSLASLDYDLLQVSGNGYTTIGQGFEADSILQGRGSAVYKTVDFATWENIGNAPESFDYGGYALIQPSPNVYVFGGGYNSRNISTCVAGLLSQSTQTLQSVAETLIEQPGIDAAEYDMTALSADVVRGYTVGRPMSARAALEPLQTAYHFDMTERDGKIYAIKRGGAVVATISDDDLGAAESPDGVKLRLTRHNESELPSEVQISYSDIDNDHQAGTQYARSLTARVTNIQQISLPLAMTSEEAAQLAEVILNAARYTGRHTLEFSLSYAWSRLTPSDVVSLPGYGVQWTARIGQVDIGMPGLVQCQASPEIAALYASILAGSDPTGIGQTIGLTGTTTLTLLDCCMLRDTDTTMAWYAALTGSVDTWPGGAAYKSNDSGATWTLATAATRTMSAKLGAATAALPNADCRVWDKTNRLNVRLQAGATLSSATEVSVLNGANAALLGAHGRWELIQWQNATLEADGTWTLSDLLRGRKGTEHAAGSHASGDVFIVPESTALQQIDVSSSELNANRQFKALTTGQLIESVDSVDATYTGERLKPLAPVMFNAAQQQNKNVNLAWTRRDRIARAWNSSASLPQSEASENYEIDVLIDGDVVRTLTATSSPIVYTSEQIGIDTAGLAETATLNLYQISADVGRGHVASQSISLAGYTITPQISTLTLGGTFAVGEIWNATINPLTSPTPITGTRIAISGDTNLDGVATALAAAVTANLGSKAASTTVAAVGSVITVTGDYAFDLSGYFSQLWVQSYTLQAASGVVAGTNEVHFIGLGGGTWGPDTVTGVLFTVTIGANIPGSPAHTVTAVGTADPYSACVWTPIYNALAADATFSAMGLVFSRVYLTSGPNTGQVSYLKVSATSPGAHRFILSAYSNDPTHNLITGNLVIGVDPVPAAVPQISEVQILAVTPPAGSVYATTINSTTYTYTTTGGDDHNDIGAGLLALINADGAMQVTAASSDSGAVRYKFTLTADANNTPFTVSASSSNGGTIAIATTQDFALS